MATFLKTVFTLNFETHRIIIFRVTYFSKILFEKYLYRINKSALISVPTMWDLLSDMYAWYTYLYSYINISYTRAIGATTYITVCD